MWRARVKKLKLNLFLKLKNGHCVQAVTMEDFASSCLKYPGTSNYNYEISNTFAGANII